MNTFPRTRDFFIAGKILAELDYAEKPPKPYTKQEPKAGTLPVQPKPWRHFCLGSQSQSAFHRAFKRWIGHAPLAYRELTPA